MNPEYLNFVNSRKSKTEEITIRGTVLDHVKTKIHDAAQVVSDFKRHLYYGLPLPSSFPSEEQNGWVTLIGPGAQKSIDLLHAVLGMLDEGCEMFDRWESDITSEVSDEINWLEEAGDMAFYFTMLLDALGVNLEEVLEANKRKLTQRYPTGFSKEHATSRDVAAEREALCNS